MPQVSGEIQMSSSLYGAILEALNTLTLLNRAKYAHRDRGHFYVDYSVKVLFAKLVAQFIFQSKIDNPSRYIKDKEDARRQASIKFARDNLDNNTVWSEDKCCFVLASAEQQDNTRQAKRTRFMDIYNDASLFN
jgi:hypothetical protein